jgi:hypothetical protein
VWHRYDSKFVAVIDTHVWDISERNTKEPSAHDGVRAHGWVNLPLYACMSVLKPQSCETDLHALSGGPFNEE